MKDDPNRTAERMFMVYMAFCAVVSLMVLAGLGWTVFELVTWVTSK